MDYAVSPVLVFFGVFTFGGLLIIAAKLGRIARALERNNAIQDQRGRADR